MKLVDSHCHIQDKAFDDDRQAVLDDSLRALEWLVVVGDDIESSRKAIQLTQENVYATAGIHPHNATEAGDESILALKALLDHPKVVAVGEIGLDYYYDNSPRDIQREAFRKQLEVAAEIHKPVVIHCRDAQEDTLEILNSFKDRLPSGIMHCFSGNPAFAEQCLQLGFYISFAGNVTFPKAQQLRDAALVVPMDRLLVETDAPYLAPKPVRGKRCIPEYTKHTAQVLADLKNVSIEELTTLTTQNAERLLLT